MKYIIIRSQWQNCRIPAMACILWAWGRFREFALIRKTWLFGSLLQKWADVFIIYSQKSTSDVSGTMDTSQ